MAPATRPLFSAFLFGCLAFSFGAEWSYHGSYDGVHNWGDHFPTCDGLAQSPINIYYDHVTEDSNLGEFSFTNFDLDSGVTMILNNNGHTVQVTYTSGDLRVSGGGLNGSEYKVLQFHFHWGSKNCRGSEHTMNGRQYPMEMHVVTYNLKYGNVSNAMRFPDGLAVLGVFLELPETEGEEEEETETGFQDLVEALRYVKKPGRSLALPPMKLEKLLPEDTDHYYRYKGSLTTPPCSEVVTWTLFKQPVPILQQQLAAFRNLRSYEKKERRGLKRLIDNFRPINPLNGRLVTKS